MKILTLPLKKKWFDMIKSGVKKEEYREMKAKYFEMFCSFIKAWAPNKYNNFDVSYHLLWPEEFKEKFDTLVFTLGYPKEDNTERRLVFKNPRLRIGTGRPEWGAEPGKQYFVITWNDA